ncbi:MAG: slipin family protein [Deferribacteraceae bacterium]|jgi:regulator of protease activity HflC (stomatin/prohibitin superfamily)|nr:slipin family protein [Deferribacteraceae bacterium]
MGLPVVIFLVILAISLLFSCVKILQEYERGVIFRLGRYVAVRGPGIILLIPYVERIVRMSLRTEVFDVPPQDIITRDNVSVKVNAVVYFRIVAPERAVLEVSDAFYATSQLSQTTLRSIIGQFELDDLLANREKINLELQAVIDRQTDPWGVKVSAVEVKHIDLPNEMQRAMARQAEAERDRRAKVINADGEFQAATKLAEASEIMNQNPITLQLRYLQTLADISGRSGASTIIPFPLELIRGAANMGLSKPLESKGKPS